ncbi:ATP-dependent helicase [Micrococcoides hystricis]|uniref:DNA 3'-5' helicase n=2 Tax=Micrococcoides hystricis TaxID=1572761 RepID=A0ABV6P8A6_9MICC
MEQNPRITSADIADALGTFRPTEEQAAVIEANLDPRLVVAGAGSGKTATMADRVAWLVANGICRPEQILGVTFTRKAAGELAERVNAKLRALVSAGLLEEPDAAEPFGEPMVSTYHSYAQSLVREHGLRLGVEPEAELINDARASMIIREILDEHREEFSEFTNAASTLVSAASRLCSESAEHLVDTTGVAAEPQRLLDTVFMPMVTGYQAQGKTPTAGMNTIIASIENQKLVAQLAIKFTQYKRENQLLDYGDLVAFAARLAKDYPQVGAVEREKYAVVLLDEFQDTSHAQLELFSALFGNGHPVTAVGDPNQSIYGFRGASAGQLASFRHRFPIVTDDKHTNSAISYLTIAWRNSESVLATANKIIDGFPAPPAGIELTKLRPAPTADKGLVELGYYLSDEEEAEAVAAAFLNQRELFLAEQQRLPEAERKQPTMAILTRTHAQVPVLIKALTDAGLDYEELALTGLLLTPEIQDLRAILALLADPMNNHGALRILTGAKYKLGAADMVAFAKWAAATQRMRDGNDAAPESEETELRFDTDDDHSVSLAEALEKLRTLPAPTGEDRPYPQPNISAAARTRMQNFAGLMQRFHSYPKHDLAGLIRFIEQQLGLDVELLANPRRSTATARANVEAFLAVAREHQASAGSSDIVAFLDMLDAAIENEKGLDKAAVETKPGAVQILTAHAAKGLEWDLVAVIGLNKGGLSAEPERNEQWVSTLGMLPWPLRGDKANLPEFTATPDPDLSWSAWERENINYFKEQVKHHLGVEERRLAYVALTRAKSYLLLTGHRFKGTTTRPREASAFLTECLELADSSSADSLNLRLVTDVESINEIDENPRGNLINVGWWPQDSFEPAPPVTISAEELEATLRTGWTPTPTPIKDALGQAARTVEQSTLQALPENELGERIGFMLDRLQINKTAHQRIELPETINPSTFVQLAKNPETVLEQWRRPMPEKPSSHARRGTAFHTWVEEHYEHSHLLDLEEVRNFADAEHDKRLDLEQMKKNFLGSRFADRQPVAIEVALQTPVSGIAVPGRIDAVFTTDDGGVELVDWKTGRKPHGQELTDNSIQLALYRLAWSRLYDVPLDKIRATFFYVASNEIVEVTDLVDEATLEGIVAAAQQASASTTSS